MREVFSFVYVGRTVCQRGTLWVASPVFDARQCGILCPPLLRGCGLRCEFAFFLESALVSRMGWLLSFELSSIWIYPDGVVQAWKWSG
jgi:hypothetical protein